MWCLKHIAATVELVLCPIMHVQVASHMLVDTTPLSTKWTAG
jgi:hypothetical protein